MQYPKLYKGCATALLIKKQWTQLFRVSHLVQQRTNSSTQQFLCSSQFSWSFPVFRLHWYFKLIRHHGCILLRETMETWMHSSQETMESFFRKSWKNFTIYTIFSLLILAIFSLLILVQNYYIKVVKNKIEKMTKFFSVQDQQCFVFYTGIVGSRDLNQDITLSYHFQVTP